MIRRRGGKFTQREILHVCGCQEVFPAKNKSKGDSGADNKTISYSMEVVE